MGRCQKVDSSLPADTSPHAEWLIEMKMKYIKTGQTRSDAKRQKLVIVDDEDYEYLNQFNWQVDKYNTVQRHTKLPNGKSGHILIHRDILKPDKNQEIDHIDRNRLNNQKSNLRLATSSQNKHNVGLRNDNTSGYKGVCWHKNLSKWLASIYINGRHTHIGLYKDKVEAAKAYNEMALKHRGEFAFLNKL